MQYVGFDAHKKYTFFTQMDASGQIRRQGKLANDRDALATFFAKIEEPARVVIEATMNWYPTLLTPCFTKRIKRSRRRTVPAVPQCRMKVACLGSVVFLVAPSIFERSPHAKVQASSVF